MTIDTFEFALISVHLMIVILWKCNQLHDLPLLLGIQMKI